MPDNDNQEIQYVDLSNLPLQEEAVLENFDPEANAYAPPPPVDDGTYLTRIKFSEREVGKQWQQRQYKDRDGHYLQTRLTLEILEGPFEGRLIFDEGFMSTGTWNSEASNVSSLCIVLGYQDELRNCRSHEDVARVLTQALSGNAIARATTRWIAKYKLSDGTFEKIKGQKNFPFENGKYIPFITNSETNEAVPARVEVIRFSAAPLGAVA